MTGHNHMHRHHARADNDQNDPFAFANEAASAVANAFGFGNDDSKTQQAKANAQTYVSIVYVTASKTFDGEIGGYSTVGQTEEATTTKPTKASVTPTQKSESVSKAAESTSSEKKTSSKIEADTTLQTSTKLPSSLVPSTSVASTIPILAATSSLSSETPSATGLSNASAASASSVSTSEKSTSSGGMSPGGKAGLAIGLLLLFGAVLALVLFFFKKRKNAAEKERLDDEKTDIFPGPNRAASTRTTATAPRLSLRPVTQFLPNLGNNEKRQSRGNALALTPSANSQQARQNGRNSPPGPDGARNPFGSHAEVIDSTNANGPPVVNDIGPEGQIVAAGAAVAASGEAIGLARGTSKRSPKQIDFTKGGPFRGPPSPAGTEFSMSSDAAPGTPTQTGTSAAIAAAGGPANSTVHRVQLDFKPSMDDELELKVGALVRLLHEYDDGWALCIRLDRSRQGVVPRTCLSTRPVKPRPQQNGPRGPPPPGMRIPNQQPRPMSPGMNQGPPRSMSPAGNGPMTPNGQNGRAMTPNGQQGRMMNPNGQQGRPMTPTGPQYNPQRPMTPNGQQGRARSPSVAQMQDRRNSPPGPSRMNPGPNPVVGSPPAPAPIVGSPTSSTGPVTRKPVGQAM